MMCSLKDTSPQNLSRLPRPCGQIVFVFLFLVSRPCVLVQLMAQRTPKTASSVRLAQAALRVWSFNLTPLKYSNLSPWQLRKGKSSRQKTWAYISTFQSENVSYPLTIISNELLCAWLHSFPCLAARARSNLLLYPTRIFVRTGTTTGNQG